MTTAETIATLTVSYPQGGQAPPVLRMADGTHIPATIVVHDGDGKPFAVYTAGPLSPQTRTLGNLLAFPPPAQGPNSDGSPTGGQMYSLGGPATER